MIAVRTRVVGAVLLAMGLLGLQPRPTFAATLSVCPSSCTYSTIQGAINAASSGDVINVYAGTYRENLTINTSLTIHGGYTGGTPTNSVVDPPPGALSSVVRVGSGMTVSIDNMTFQNGSTSQGMPAGISNNGILSLDYVAVQGNYGRDAAGGIYNSGTLTVTNSIISNNTSSTGLGGGIDNYGAAYLTNDTLLLNSGGAIVSNNTVTVTGSYFNGNDDSGAVEPASDLYVRQGSATVQQSSFTGGQTALYSDSHSASLTVTEDLFTGYTYSAIVNVSSLAVSSSTFVYNPGFGYGGAIRNGDLYATVGGQQIGLPGTATVVNSTISQNTANQGAGIYNFAAGPLTLTNDTISGNSSTGGGGGLFVQPEPLNFPVQSQTLSNTILAGNTTNGTSDDCVGTLSNGAGHNIQGTTQSCGLGTGSGNQIGVDPTLGTLTNVNGIDASNGEVLIPQSGSPALSQGDAATCESLVGSSGTSDVDQRGSARHSATRGDCDIGAYDTGVQAQAPTGITGVSGSGTYAGTATLTATLQSGATGLSGKSIAFTLNGHPACGGTNQPTCPTTDNNGLATLQNADLSGINAGSYPSAVGASFTGDSNYGSSSATGALAVGTATQTITFGTLSPRTYGDPAFHVSATASSGLPITFSDNGPCTVSQNPSTGIWTVALTGAGTGTNGCTITASQGGNSNYTAAASVSQSFDIAKGTPTFTFDLSTLPAKTYGTGAFSVASYARTTSTGTISFAPGAGSVGCNVTSDGTVTITGVALNAASCVIQASLAPDGNYLAAGPILQSFHIAKADQTISFGPLSSHTYGDGSFTVSATASSSLPVSFGTHGPCTVAQNPSTGAWNVTITGAGTGGSGCTVTASQSGDGNYNAAPSVSQSFDVAKAAASITLSNLSATYDGNPHLASVTTSPSVSYSASYTDASNTSVPSPTNAGSYSVRVIITDPNYTGNLTGFMIIDKANQSITVTGHAPSTAVYNAAFTVAATASSGLSVSYGTFGPCSNSGATVTMTGSSGGCTVTYDQPGNRNYNPAPTVGETVTAQKASQTITFSPLANHIYGDAPFTVLATASSGLQVSLSASGSCAISSSTVTITGAGSCTVTASQSGDSNFTAASSVPQVFTIAKASTTTTVTSSATPSILKQGVTFTVTVSSGAGTPGGTVSLKDGTTTVASGVQLGTGGTATFTTTALTPGTHNITATYSGSANFAGSTSGTLSQQVRYAVKVLSTSSLTVVLQLQDVTGANVSASSLTVTAQCVVTYSQTPPTTCGASPVQTINKSFGWSNTYKGMGPAYSYNVNSRNLTKGQQYDLLVQTDGDPIWHAVAFTY